MTSSDRKLRTEKPVTPFVLPLGPGTSSTLAGPFGPPRKGKRRRKNKHVVKNSRLWSTINTKDKGCGDLQDQKWMNMGTEEGQGEEHPCQCPMLPGGMWGAGGGCLRVLCPQSWRSGERGQDHWQWGSPYPVLLLLLPGDAHTVSSAGARRKLMQRLGWLVGLCSERLATSTFLWLSKVVPRPGLGG